MDVRAAVAGLLIGWSISACGGGSGKPPADTTAPTVATANVADLATNVATDLAITVQFSEPMDTASVAAAFGVTGPSGPVAGTIAWDAAHQVATFTPAAPYPPATAFVAALGAGARDLAGNALQGSWQVHFTTAAVPEVDYTFPADGQAAVSVQYVLRVVVYFKVPMDGPSVEGAFSLADGAGAPVAGTAQYVLEDGIVPALHFTLAGPLAGLTTYTGTLTTAALSEGGVPLANPYSFSFTTAAAAQAHLVVGNDPTTYWMNMFGRVIDDRGRIDCGGTASACAADYDVGSTVTLTAVPAQAGVFVGWAGGCAGLTTPSVTLTMDVGKDCTAVFDSTTTLQTLTITYGAWIELIQSTPATWGATPDIYCGPGASPSPSVCSAGFLPALYVDLTAATSAGAPVGTISWVCDGDDLAYPGATVTTSGPTKRVWMTRPKSCNVTLVPTPP